MAIQDNSNHFSFVQNPIQSFLTYEEYIISGTAQTTTFRIPKTLSSGRSARLVMSYNGFLCN